MTIPSQVDDWLHLAERQEKNSTALDLSQGAGACW